MLLSVDENSSLGQIWGGVSRERMNAEFYPVVIVYGFHTLLCLCSR